MTTTTTRRFVTVPNGFGGTTTRRVTATPPTTESTGYLRSLLAERTGPAVVSIRDDLNRRRLTGTLTQEAVSDAIRKLLAL